MQLQDNLKIAEFIGTYIWTLNNKEMTDKKYLLRFFLLKVAFF